MPATRHGIACASSMPCRLISTQQVTAGNEGVVCMAHGQSTCLSAAPLCRLWRANACITTGASPRPWLKLRHLEAAACLICLASPANVSSMPPAAVLNAIGAAASSGSTHSSKLQLHVCSMMPAAIPTGGKMGIAIRLATSKWHLVGRDVPRPDPLTRPS